jgi:opine dehydrogenase
MKIAVLGAGHGGQAMAGDLTLAGHEVRLGAVEGHSTNLKILQIFGGIVVEGMTSTGAPTGFARPAMITTDCVKAIRGADVIMIVVPAFAQETYIRLIVEHGERGQIIVFNPGKFGTLALAQQLRQAGRIDDFLIGETSTFIFAARTRGLGHVDIKGVKKELPYSALPSVRTAEAIMTLMDLYPQISPSLSVFQTSIDAPGIILHPITTILNMSRIEQIGPYRSSHYDITPSVARIMEAVDEERMTVARKICYETFSFKDNMSVLYRVKGESAYDVMYQISAHNVLMSPENMQVRYITEDVPYGMVTVASIGKLLGMATPRLDAIVNIACMANGADYWATGRTAEKLGLTGMSITELIDYATHGTYRAR